MLKGIIASENNNCPHCWGSGLVETLIGKSCCHIVCAYCGGSGKTDLKGECKNGQT